MFVVTGTLELNLDADGRLRLPDWLATELRRSPFVLEAAQDADGHPVLVGLPRTAAPDARLGVIDQQGRLAPPPEGFPGVAAEGKAVRLLGCGLYFILGR